MNNIHLSLYMLTFDIVQLSSPAVYASIFTLLHSSCYGQLWTSCTWMLLQFMQQAIFICLHSCYVQLLTLYSQVLLQVLQEYSPCLVTGWHHHHPQLPLLSAGSCQQRVRSLGWRQGRWEHRLHANHLVSLWHDFHHQGWARWKSWHGVCTGLVLFFVCCFFLVLFFCLFLKHCLSVENSGYLPGQDYSTCKSSAILTCQWTQCFDVCKMGSSVKSGFAGKRLTPPKKKPKPKQQLPNCCKLFRESGSM